MQILSASLFALIALAVSSLGAASELPGLSEWAGMLANSTAPLGPLRLQLSPLEANDDGGGNLQVAMPNLCFGPNRPKRAKCQAGYFCILDGVCLPGNPAKWSPMALIEAAVTARLGKVLGPINCIKAAGGMAVDLMKSFALWKLGQWTAAVKSLYKSISNIHDLLGSCFKLSWSGLLKEILEHALKTFFPTQVGAFTIIVKGVNIIQPFLSMTHLCSDHVKDYISCGGQFGDFILSMFPKASGLASMANATNLTIA